MRTRSPALLPTVLIVGLAAVLAGLFVVALAVSKDRGTDEGDSARVPPIAGRTEESRALRILAGWDRRRAAAWARGDVAGLASLYVPGSTAGARDRSMLREYVDRGLVVRGMRMQVFSVDVTSLDRDEARLVVTDRLARATAVGDGRRMRLPRDQATTRTIALERRNGRWLVAEVRGAA